jgi:hypothetical protein
MVVWCEQSDAIQGERVMGLVDLSGAPLIADSNSIVAGWKNKYIKLPPTKACTFTRYVMYYFAYLKENGGALPRDLPAHALMTYYGFVSIQYEEAKDNLVYEHEPSLEIHARNTAESVASLYDVTLETMFNYWSAITAQRRKLGLNQNADLPTWLMFPNESTNRKTM